VFGAVIPQPQFVLKSDYAAASIDVPLHRYPIQIAINKIALLGVRWIE
jgi:hypothetical protein